MREQNLKKSKLTLNTTFIWQTRWVLNLQHTSMFKYLPKYSQVSSLYVQILSHVYTSVQNTVEVHSRPWWSLPPLENLFQAVTCQGYWCQDLQTSVSMCIYTPPSPWSTACLSGAFCPWSGSRHQNIWQYLDDPAPWKRITTILSFMCLH